MKREVRGVPVSWRLKITQLWLKFWIVKEWVFSAIIKAGLVILKFGDVPVVYVIGMLYISLDLSDGLM